MRPPPAIVAAPPRAGEVPVHETPATAVAAFEEEFDLDFEALVNADFNFLDHVEVERRRPLQPAAVENRPVTDQLRVPVHHNPQMPVFNNCSNTTININYR